MAEMPGHRPLPDYPPRFQDLKRDLAAWWDTTVNIVAILAILGFFALCLFGVISGAWYLITL